jgi:hypothetical protein
MSSRRLWVCHHGWASVVGARGRRTHRWIYGGSSRRTAPPAELSFSRNQSFNQPKLLFSRKGKDSDSVSTPQGKCFKITLLFAACLLCPRLSTRVAAAYLLHLRKTTGQPLDTTAASLDHPGPANWSPCALLLPFLVWNQILRIPQRPQQAFFTLHETARSRWRFRPWRSRSSGPPRSPTWCSTRPLVGQLLGRPVSDDNSAYASSIIAERCCTLASTKKKKRAENGLPHCLRWRRSFRLWRSCRWCSCCTALTKGQTC